VQSAFVGTVVEFGATTFPPAISHARMLVRRPFPLESAAVFIALVLAVLKLASTTEDRRPMMAITTRSSMRVNPRIVDSLCIYI